MFRDWNMKLSFNIISAAFELYSPYNVRYMSSDCCNTRMASLHENCKRMKKFKTSHRTDLNSYFAGKSLINLILK